MQVDKIDQIRNEFFDKLKQEKIDKEAAILRQQTICVHKYDILGRPNANGYQPRICSKCNYSTVKSLRELQGATCNIS